MVRSFAAGFCSGEDTTAALDSALAQTWGGSGAGLAFTPRLCLTVEGTACEGVGTHGHTWRGYTWAHGYA